jgi:hypothetical protein
MKKKKKLKHNNPEHEISTALKHVKDPFNGPNPNNFQIEFWNGSALKSTDKEARDLKLPNFPKSMLTNEIFCLGGNSFAKLASCFWQS